MSSPTQHDDLDDQLPRYVIGIDLGTTNSAVSFVDSELSPSKIQSFAITQLIAPGQLESRDALPSFAYLPLSEEREAIGTLPWQSKASNDDWVTGCIARDDGARNPSRQVVSAKSWLCHSGVDRTAKLLPWQATEDVKRISPVDASSFYLGHIRDAWNHKHRDQPFEEQEIVVTIPASFDEIARELTVLAAKQAGIKRLTLIEEPQAAFYSWLDRHHDNWEQVVNPGDHILVCDVGGGTSDFTLIQARRDEAAEASVRFHRVAVGDHLILGGDNLDLTLAQLVESRLETKGGLPSHAWDRVLAQCRRVKEQALSDNSPEEFTIHVSDRGSKLIGGGTSVKVSAEEIRSSLLSGFFPQVDLDSKPQHQTTGFTEFGLPYATDPAVTRHLAEFLSLHTPTEQESEAPFRPDILLFNGGVFQSKSIRESIISQLETWYRPAMGESWSPKCLEHDRLDLAVSNGAAYYGMVRRGQGVRITAGLARTYYIGAASTEAPDQGAVDAVCLVPAGQEPGSTIELESPVFHLRLGTPIELPMFSSSVRLNDSPGEVIPIDPVAFRRLPAIKTVIQSKKGSGADQVAIRLLASLTEVGTMELSCHEIDGPRTWRLQFDVRAATNTDTPEIDQEATSGEMLDEATWRECERHIEQTFSDKAYNPDALLNALAESLGEDKEVWPSSTMRRLWQILLDHGEGRKLSARHESRWLNLVGYCLRPGYGMPLDDWRVSTTWKQVQGKLFHGSPTCRAESWIVWRRLAGGLTDGQQQTLAQPLLTAVRAAHKQSTTGRGKGAAYEFGSHEAAEIWRLLGSLERLPMPLKIELGDMILDLFAKPRFEAARDPMIWTLGRLGTRLPIYGLMNCVVPANVAQRWLLKLLKLLPGEHRVERLAVMQIARKCNDRHRDIDASTRESVLKWLQETSPKSSGEDVRDVLYELVENGGRLASEQQAEILGDSLPVGLSIR